MSTYPKISIVTPSFNQGEFLEETIRSVLEQGYPNLEYFIIDGGSDDNSVDIIRRYEDHLTYWVSEPDQGQTEAINKGFSRATGEIMAWLNSDDTYLPGALARIAAFYQAFPQVGLVYGDALNIDAEGNVISRRKGRAYSLAAMLEDNLVPQPAAFFSHQAWKRHGPLDVERHYIMDRAFWLRIARDMKIVYLPQPLATMRRHGDAKTTRDGIQVKLEEKQFLDEYFAQGQVPAEAEKARHAAYGRLSYYLGIHYLNAEQFNLAKKAFIASLRYQPVHRRVLVILPMMLSCVIRVKHFIDLYSRGMKRLSKLQQKLVEGR